MGVKIYYYTNYEDALSIINEGVIRAKDCKGEPGVYFTEVPPNYAKVTAQLNSYNDGIRCLQSSKRKSSDVCLAFDANSIGAKHIPTQWWRNEWMTKTDVAVYGCSQIIIRTE